MLTVLVVLAAIILIVQLSLLALATKIMKVQKNSDTGSLRTMCEALERSQGQLNERLSAEMAGNRAEGAAQSKATREEVLGIVQALGQSIQGAQNLAGQNQTEQLSSFSQRLNELQQAVQAQLGQSAKTLDSRLAAVAKAEHERWEQKRVTDLAEAKQSRAEMSEALTELANSVTRNVNSIGELQRQNNEAISARMEKIAENTEKRLETLRGVVDKRLETLHEENGKKLEQMRVTVDEKLQGTLEQRLGESFKQVSERLEQVHQGLGEMQALASGVGDLKKVLTNVKTRGTWGEVQLGNLLEQVLSQQQYERNVKTAPGRGELVEFAIKLPGRDDGQDVVWLPIDAKFPHEDYERLMQAQDAGDVAGIELAGKQLESQVKKCARDIRDKYLAPPHTTDFGILFLPTEGLYAEVIRRPGLVENLQREFRITVAGPTTLTAILNSLQMGFRTLAIQKQSSEVWTVLGEVKTEFMKYGGVLDRVKKKLTEAQNTVEQAEVRTRSIERKLRRVEALPTAENGEIKEELALAGVDNLMLDAGSHEE